MEQGKLIDGECESELVFEKKLTKFMRDYANTSAELRYAKKLIDEGQIPEKGALYYKFGYKEMGKIVCIGEFDKTSGSGRKYFWKNHVESDVKELMGIVYPVKYLELDSFFE